MMYAPVRSLFNTKHQEISQEYKIDGVLTTNNVLIYLFHLNLDYKKLNERSLEYGNNRNTLTASIEHLRVHSVSPSMSFGSLYIKLFNGAETNCGIAHILDILLMNRYDT